MLLTKSNDPQSYSNDHKRSICTSVCYEIPNLCVPIMVSQLWNWLQIICRKKNSIIFLSDALITLAHMCTVYKWGLGITSGIRYYKWGLGITPKTPSSRHTSLGTMQQCYRMLKKSWPVWLHARLSNRQPVIESIAAQLAMILLACAWWT